MPESWRDTLYVWDGIVKVKDDDDSGPEVSLTWHGTWVPCENCSDATKAETPKRLGAAINVESTNEFSVSGSTKFSTLENEETNSTANPHEVSLAEGQGWDMGEGTDKMKYQDSVHNLLWENIRWMGNMRDHRDNLVFAKGYNDFGNFISAGWMRPGCRLTLARRYLEDDDARVKWDLEDLKKHVIGGIFDETSGKVNIPPWQCGALHSDIQKPGKRKQTDEVK
jgi:hypothetical protein